jgi:hypothetical protein
MGLERAGCEISHAIEYAPDVVNVKRTAAVDALPHSGQS